MTFGCGWCRMKLPIYENAAIPKTKIADYLLSLSHRDGRSKAKFFLRFGFSQDQWEELAKALKKHAATNEVFKMERTHFGMRYVVEGKLESPDGRNPRIRSIWFIENDASKPSFVTAYPLKGK